MNVLGLDFVYGGVAAPVAYAAVGCVGFTAVKYCENPDASYRELGISCATGAVHSMNPAFGLTGRVVTSPVAKYGAGIAYGVGVKQFEKSANAFFDEPAHTCEIRFESAE